MLVSGIENLLKGAGFRFLDASLLKQIEVGAGGDVEHFEVFK